MAPSSTLWASQRSQTGSQRVGDYLLGRTIGEGADSRVVYAQHVDTGLKVAIKVLDKEALLTRGGAARFPREVAALRRLRHPHAVTLLGVLSSPSTLYMVMELVAGGDLYDRIAGEGPLKEAEARRLFCQLLSALGACHAAGVFHRDIKPENVLLTEGGDAKLADFGLGCVAGAQDLLRTACGTMQYTAPEVLRDKGYHGGPSDLWSLANQGVVLFVMLTGELPFDADTPLALMQCIAAADYSLPPTVSAAAAATLRAMLCPDPAARAGIEEVWDMDWVAAWQGDAPGEAARARWGADLCPEAQAAEALLEPGSDSASGIEEVSEPGSPVMGGSHPLLAGPFHMNAFQLLRANLDISAIFEGRQDVVKRRTRLTCGPHLGGILHRIQAAVEGVGGHVARRSPNCLSMSVPIPAGILTVRLDAHMLVPGKHLLDISRVSGPAPAFYKWQAVGSSQALAAFRVINQGLDLGSLFAPSTHFHLCMSVPIPAGILTVRLDAHMLVPGKHLLDISRVSGPAPAFYKWQAVGSSQALAAFRVINQGLDLGSLFAPSTHFQFTSREGADTILDSVRSVASDLGCAVHGAHDDSLTLERRTGGANEAPLSLRFQVLGVLPDLQVCQVSMLEGAPTEFQHLRADLVCGLSGIMTASSGKKGHP
ncbi:CBL-interacting serine/threonine-protein kinase 23 [Auxenochlorella protothecoides]|uniref:non-specific serine/threonine protein kinase n=1 Tax=Auxenochlorella protothecoides TaxID=3075 RepID=A0A087SSW2_AUXPR|nr:CBL-interacting serine/threonine-protein kinase 23 [Auxenochlorella protothecoides]KFM28816.1 CBL-interacting serine/threonine-protein kinase 23 [Auxenochlorella protothecoides]